MSNTRALSLPTALSSPTYAALLLRISLGIMFIAHAALKYFVFTLPGTAQFFSSLGLPAGLAYITFFAELIGGMMILGGVYARWVALALVPILLGALWAHSGNGWVFTSTNGGWEYPLFLTTTTLAFVHMGDSKFALLPTPSEFGR